MWSSLSLRHGINSNFSPPDFSKLPVPRDKDEDEIKEKKSIDLSKVLDESKSSNEIKSPSKIEKIISDLLKKKWK